MVDLPERMFHWAGVPVWEAEALLGVFTLRGAMRMGVPLLVPFPRKEPVRSNKARLSNGLLSEAPRSIVRLVARHWRDLLH